MRLGKFSFFISLWAILCGSSVVRGDDWPQWQGPNRDGIWREAGVIESFPKDGPPIAWRAPIGAGYAGPSVANGRVYVMDRFMAPDEKSPTNAFDRGVLRGMERVVCLKESDGS